MADEELVTSKRYTLLQEAADSAISRWSQQQQKRLHSIVSLLPSTITKDSNYATEMLTEVNSNVAKEMSEVFATRLRDLDLHAKLTKLDEIVDAQSENQDIPAWRPSGCPSNDLAAHLITAIQKHTKILEDDVVIPLKNQLAELHKEALALQSVVEANEKEIESAISKRSG